MKQYAEHNRIGISHALRGDDTYVRVFSGGYQYLDGGVLVRSSKSKPIYSYGKNYEKDGTKFALFIWTTDSDQSRIEELFDMQSLTVTKEQVEQTLGDGSFVYLN